MRFPTMHTQELFPNTTLRAQMRIPVPLCCPTSGTEDTLTLFNLLGI